MNKKTLPLVALVLILIIGISAITTLILFLGLGPIGYDSTVAIAGSSGAQPTPVEVHDPSATGYQPLTVEHVEVQVGVGSPIPVDIVASGTWPELCSQIAEVQNTISGFQINVTLLASTSESCPPDHLGIPFRIAIPLNIVEMESGTYTITVNGADTSFDIPVQ